ncbi:uncharacterized protein LOC133900278 [Phragmites australis]|uniref:uncharacterized protein LOC133900278 n=1 Tax=Phragmites australis TaxID=29695 RepID=UPI002D7988E9|nr:uncharacterized protein LOC133900278 [Phragmites australis]
MAANDEDLASSSLVPAPDDEYSDCDLLKVEVEDEYEKEKAIANNETIAHTVHEAELISEVEGTVEAIISDKAIAHLLTEEVEMSGDSDTDDGEEEKDEEMGDDSNTDKEEEEEMGGDSNMIDDDEEKEDEEMDES